MSQVLGWSSTVWLGDKTMDGIRALGNRREYAVAAGTMGNEKPIAITVDDIVGPGWIADARMATTRDRGSL